ncbi:MAG: hypothetical protein K2X77_05035 [Candidatus Obscuribacterales bacterium]|nr:hypothetical protein [Candidatus Obscuribacterales bacterium]
MKKFLPIFLSLAVLCSSIWADAQSAESAQTILNQAHEALAGANYGLAIELYDGLMKHARDDDSAKFTIRTSRGIAKALAGLMVEAEADLNAAAKSIPIPLEELKAKDPRHLVQIVQMYQWRYLTHLTLKKWNDAVIDIDALRTIGAASNNAGAKADRAKLNLLLGQDELGLTQLGEAARLHPVYKFEYEYAKKALTYEDSKALYLATIASQLIGSASALKLGFQLSLRAPARPQKAGG